MRKDVSIYDIEKSNDISKKRLEEYSFNCIVDDIEDLKPICDLENNICSYKLK
jgi:hypothetical protein